MSKEADVVRFCGTHGTDITANKRIIHVQYYDGECLDVPDNVYDIFATNAQMYTSAPYDYLLGSYPLSFQQRYEILVKWLSKFTSLSSDRKEEFFIKFIKDKSGLYYSDGAKYDLSIEKVAKHIANNIEYNGGYDDERYKY